MSELPIQAPKNMLRRLRQTQILALCLQVQDRRRRPLSVSDLQVQVAEGPLAQTAFRPERVAKVVSWHSAG